MSVARVPLSRRLILDAALRILDHEGIAGLTMRRLGRELGAEAMSIYGHVPSKPDVIAGVKATLFGQIEETVTTCPLWRDHLRLVMQTTHGVAQEHPCFFPLLFSSPPVPESLSRRDADLAALTGAGFGPEQARLALNTLVGYVAGVTTGGLDGSAVSGQAASEPLFGQLALFDFGLEAILDGLESRLLRLVAGARGTGPS